MLIFVPKITNRLGYTLNVVFGCILQQQYTITIDAKTFAESNEAKLCYGDVGIDGAPFIKAKHLLFETSIEEQDTHCFAFGDTTALFPTYGKDLLLPFDVFAATFYLVSRYEEYLPHHNDEHGRFMAADSVAFKNGFLRQAVIDRWAHTLYEKLQAIFPDLPTLKNKYECEVTIDIDAAFCYLHKNMVRTVAGFLRDYRQPDLIKERISVLLRKRNDPFDTFNFILDTQQQNTPSRLLFFALLGDYDQYDKPTSYNNKSFRELLQNLGDFSKIGIHASYNVLERPELIKVEAKRLTDILHRPIVRNRFHFLRFRLPQSFRDLRHASITHDYSMGYAEEPGFRAGTSTPHPFYDLERDEETNITSHPFVAMDITLKKYKNYSAQEAFDTYKQLIDECRLSNSTFSAIWHNQNICDNAEWGEWRQLFEKTLTYASNNK